MNKNNENYEEILLNFLDTVYQNILDDYNHIVKYHNNEIEEIYNYIINKQKFNICDINKCLFTSRHHQINNYGDDDDDESKNNQQQQQYKKIDFYKETMDSIHFYFMHCFDAGLRTLKNQRNLQQTQIKNDNDNDNEYQYFDAKFASIKQTISQKNKNTASFRRFARSNNTKFTIKTELDQQYIDTNDDKEGKEEMKDDGGETFLDSIYSHLCRYNVDEGILNGFKKYLEDEEYETDSLLIDVDQIGIKGNISNHIKDTNCIQIIKKFIQTLKGLLSFTLLSFNFYLFMISYINVIN